MPVTTLARSAVLKWPTVLKSHQTQRYLIYNMKQQNDRFERQYMFCIFSHAGDITIPLTSAVLCV